MSVASQTEPTAEAAPKPPAYNRLGIDYQAVPRRKVAGPIVDAHTHTHNVAHTREFLRAADAYQIGEIWTMAPVEDIDAFHEAFPGRFHFIAVPKWPTEGTTAESFITEWLKRLDAYYAKGSRLAKFHMAPGSRKRFGVGLDHPLVQRVLKHAYDLGYHFMSHIGDPLAWFAPEARYGKDPAYGTFKDQFGPLDRVLEQFPDRIHMGAHMGGSMEDLDALERRLERFPQYCVDSSATKWIVRAVALQDPERVRSFMVRWQDRILFGSDLVVGDKYNFDHYASRYWTHLQLWESGYRGESPIEDPDAPNGVPPLVGLDLPPAVLEKMYRTNVATFLRKTGG